jgi:hypothetical protein
MKSFLFASFLSAILLATAPLMAQTDSSEIMPMKRQLQSLEERVTRLEALQPTFTSFMPDFAERFHVMHLAGDVGDWAVATHELNELRRMTAFSKYIDSQKGNLMKSMLEPNFSALEGAIGHGNHDKFAKALAETLATCNSCHVATGSAFIKVTLGVDDALSLRHPHALAEQAAPHGHKH